MPFFKGNTLNIYTMKIKYNYFAKIWIINLNDMNF